MKWFVAICWLIPVLPLWSNVSMQSAEIIAGARAAVASEAAIESFVTLQIEGQIVPADAALPVAKVYIVARRPMSQRVEIHMDDLIETTILNGRQGCLLRSNSSDRTSRHMRLLNPHELATITGSTREIFAFFIPDRANGETVEYRGIEQRLGERVHHLVYRYPDGRETVRFFQLQIFVWFR